MIQELLQHYKSQTMPEPDAKMYRQMLVQKRLEQQLRNREYQNRVAQQNRPQDQ